MTAPDGDTTPMAAVPLTPTVRWARPFGALPFSHHRHAAGGVPHRRVRHVRIARSADSAGAHRHRRPPGLILQTIPFMLVGAMMSAAVSTFVSADALERHVPKSLAGGLAMAMIGGLCLPVCDCMVVPTFANLVRKRLPLPYATALPVARPR